MPETRPWSLTCRDGADAESSCTESRTDSWAQDGARNPWSAPTIELWAPTRRKLDKLQSEFLDQLSSYEFKSLQPDSMSISPDTYQPAHEGYDPAFESSASDVIRIIWAYLLSLQRVSGDLGLNHPGLVIFDEPRQQMAHEVSFRELLFRAAAIGGQVVFATSETQQNLTRMLDGLDHNMIDFDGKVLKPLTG